MVVRSHLLCEELLRLERLYEPSQLLNEAIVCGCARVRIP